MCLRRRLETGDQLRLLAGLAGDQDYEPPFVRLADWLDSMHRGGGGGSAAQDRAAQIMAAADALGGEVG